MAGVKGRSGRQPWDREAETRQLWALSIPVLKRALHPRSKVSPDRKIEIALELVKKMLPAQVSGANGGPIPLLLVNALDSIAVEPALETNGRH